MLGSRKLKIMPRRARENHLGIFANRHRFRKLGRFFYAQLGLPTNISLFGPVVWTREQIACNANNLIDETFFQLTFEYPLG